MCVGPLAAPTQAIAPVQVAQAAAAAPASSLLGVVGRNAIRRRASLASGTERSPLAKSLASSAEGTEKLGA